MVSGPDIITYIGVPLAVLGVLPIIYNTIATLATVAKVRRILRHGRLAGITRGDVINHVIEIELPRYTIAPLDRQEQYKDYWRLCEHPSQIPGGSWTLFNWKSNVIGLKTQRIDYSDQLRQPQAEIGFEELISFLLDIGAVPDPVGFRMLRGSGLWVPRGTPLLLSPDKHEKVLTIGPLEDSDGHLSLSVRWSSHWAMRDQNSLPPYWVKIKGALPKRPVTAVTGEEDSKDGVRVMDDTEALNPQEEKRPATSKYMPEAEDSPPTIRCQVGLSGLISAIPDDYEAGMFEGLETRHLEVDESMSNTTGIWFASAITAFGTSSQTILWNYKIPSEVLAFSKKDTLPCGVLVLLEIVDESVTPEWASQYNDIEEERAAQSRAFKETSRALLAENQLPQAQKAAAIRARQLKSHDDWVEALSAKRRRDAQRAETRMSEALQSPKWGNRLVAEHTLKWLKKEGHVSPDESLNKVVEVLLWRMVVEPTFAADLGSMLDLWKAFVDNGGIKKADYMMLNDDKLNFAYASLLLSIIEDSATAAHGSLALDLQECMRIWKIVRLG